MPRLCLLLLLWVFSTAWATPTPTPIPSPQAIPSPSPAAAAPSPSPLPIPKVPVRLRVAVGGSPPFVVKTSLGLDGVAVHLWELMASQLGLLFEYSYYTTPDEALAAMGAGKADIVVGPITMTHERVKTCDLTVPFFISHLGILTHAHTRTLYDRLTPFLNEAFWIGTAAMLFFLTLVGWLVWLSERKVNSAQFPPGWRRGMEDGIWFAMSTMTGVGYGDLYPKSSRGRFVAGFWMLLGSVFFSTLTAGIATAMTLAHLPATELNSTRQLTGQRVATITELNDEVLDHSGASVYRMADLEACMKLFDEGRVDAVVYSHPGLEYMVRAQKREVDLTLSASLQEITLLAFALPRRSPLTERLNGKILELYETEQLRRNYNHWMNNLAPLK